MTARQAAMRDIKDGLHRDGKCFLAFRKRLDPTMRELVRDALERQSLVR